MNDKSRILRWIGPPPEKLRKCPKVGLALSAGAARGLAHVGVIQVLEEHSIPVHAVAGSSMGAYVGALWCAGKSGHDLQNLAAEIPTRWALFRLLDPALPPFSGIFRGNRLRARLDEDLHGATFADLKKEFYVTASDIASHELYVIKSGSVAMAVHASAAVPGLCVPVILDGRELVDGGVVDPLPVDVLRDAGCEIIISSSVVPSPAEVSAGMEGIGHLPRSWLAKWNPFSAGNLIDILRRSITSAQIRTASMSECFADIVLRPHTAGTQWHDYHHWRHYIDLGRAAAEEKLPALVELTAATSTPNSHECAVLPLDAALALPS
ncbi:MAG TPA: patatin-like phospholipase family protein [Verrucomicrobiales bacterium]|nr:patatin-like phospholipase family protein [Verrucomicrobiales bacterium]